MADRTPEQPDGLFRMDGLVALITGGGTGIGLMMAKALAGAGATVYICGRRKDVIEKAAIDNSQDGRIRALHGDVTNHEDLVRLAETIATEKGYLDLLINNAGIVRNLFAHPLPSPPLGEESPSIKDFQEALLNTGAPSSWAETFEANVTAPYYTTIAFLDLLHKGNLRQKTGSQPTAFPHHSSQVITVSSAGGFRIDAKVLSPSYTVAKAATTHLGKMLANILRPWGIRSNILAPGVWPSEMTTPSVKTGITFSADSLAKTGVPLGRAGTEDEMAGTILYLASRAGAFLNGSVLLVDGGRVASVATTY